MGLIKRMVTYRMSGVIGGSELAKVMGVVGWPVTKHRPHEKCWFFSALQLQIRKKERKKEISEKKTQ